MDETRDTHDEADERSGGHRDGQTGGEGRGQVSEVSSMKDAGEEIQPHDSVSGAPGEARDDLPDTGTAGPDAPPRHGIPEESNESSR